MADLEGRTIETVRKMTEEEFEDNFSTTGLRFKTAPVLVLDNGTKLFPAADHEGNGTGALFGETDDDTKFAIAFKGAD